MTKIRHLHRILRQVQPVEVAVAFDDDPAGWLSNFGRAHAMSTLLAHADDGVVWGRIDDGGLRTARDVFPGQHSFAVLRAGTVQQARLFGPDSELLLWRGEGAWRARRILDGQGGAVEAYDEWQLLWGTRAEEARDGFTLVAEGAQGLRHAPPVEVRSELFAPAQGRHPLRLQVRHYLETEPESGLLRVALSRLVRVTDETWVGEEYAQ